ncbi:UDP-N-acetylmuramoylalanine--D-glutamate ligase [Peptococcaceae bacterium CEB3]|nr:UDP-N-acetylmuramoylalanine--D-glutamate ligase [Peptococcaceae bacterium CEB3]
MNGIDSTDFGIDFGANFKDKRVLVVGSGLSGQGAAALLASRGAKVFITDRKPARELPEVAALGLPEERMFLDKTPDLAQVRPELIVLSPGVSPRQGFIQEALARRIPVWSEVELALRNCPAVSVGVTGTNGKTTTTTLIGELAKLTGRKTVVAGNIGVALSHEVVGLTEEDIVVAELSSFQLEFVDRARLHIAVMLNLTPDHLDRHGSVEKYLEAKANIFAHQKERDLAILNWDDPIVRGLAPQLKARVLFFSPTRFLEDGISLKGDMIVFAAGGVVEPILQRGELQLRGSHNLENVMAAAAAARELGLPRERIAAGLRGFKGVEHRQEVVGTFEGILFVNDSKGTNTDAAAKALLAFSEPLVLLAGGKNKGLDFHDFMTLVRERVKSLVLLGQAADEMEQAAREAGVSRILRAGSFPEGVETAIAEAQAGDVVLLSPACTSWDMFKSYEERGELFKELVRRHYTTQKSEVRS